MKTLFTFIATLFMVTIIIPVNVSKGECIKFKPNSAAFKKPHKAPATCSEIYQNGEYTTKARYGVSNSGTSSGTYKRKVTFQGENGHEWEENWTVKTFAEKCPQTKVHWNNSTVESTNWKVTYKFTEEPHHSVSYYAKFTIGQPQYEGKTLKEGNISTEEDNSPPADVTTWIVSNPYPPNLPDDTYRAWRNSGETVYKLYKKTNGTWIDLYNLPKSQ